MAIFLARYFADGDLDLTFGGNGVVRTQIDNYLDVRSISIGQQGQITVLVGGNSMLHHITCSASGTVETQGSSPFFPDPGSPVHPSSQVFAATMWSPPIPEVDPAVAEEILSPVLDRTRLMAAGWVITNRITEVAVASYLVSGAPDTHFGNSGQPNGQFTDRPLLANAAQAWGLHEGSDGRVLVAGFADSSEDSQYNFLVLRLLPNGFLDQSFNQEGRALTRFPGASSVARTVTSDGTGRVVAVGSAERATDSITRLAMARYLRDGTLDQQFGESGLVTVLPSWARSTEAYAVTLDGQGRIVVIGTGDVFGFGQGVMVARFIGDGRPDGTFGVSGFAPPSLVPSPALVTGMHVDPMHGKITVVGGANGQSFMMRLTDHGGVAPFGVDGVVLTSLGRPNERSQIDVITVDAYGRIVVAGVTSQ